MKSLINAVTPRTAPRTIFAVTARAAAAVIGAIRVLMAVSAAPAGPAGIAIPAAMLLGSVPAHAHHSFAMFDFSKTTTVTGTIKEFRWTNPHVILLISAAPQNGAAEEVWSMELTSPGNLTRGGWSRHSFKPGDRIELEFSPLRDGRHGGAFKKAKMLDTGQVITSDLRAAEKPGLQ
jgi:hypothetical protein